MMKGKPMAGFTKTRRLMGAMIFAVITITGCATSTRDMFPLDPDKTIKKTWDAKTGGSLPSDSSLQHRAVEYQVLPTRNDASLRDEGIVSTDSTRESAGARRLPNPDLQMYVFPHFNGEAFVPGYTTTFPMYSVVKYIGSDGTR